MAAVKERSVYVSVERVLYQEETGETYAQWHVAAPCCGERVTVHNETLAYDLAQMFLEHVKDFDSRV